MRLRFTLLALAGGALLTAGFATAGSDARPPQPHKTTICHKTGSSKKPYVRLTVSNRALAAHRRHSQDIIPAPAGGCPTQALTAHNGGRPLSATLTGANGGDADGTGTATIRVNHGQGTVCFTLNVRNIMLPATAAHIHRVSTSAIVVPLVAPDAAGAAQGCVQNVSRALVKELLQNPGAFYVNVHTTDFPNGAVRGDLSK